MAHALVRAASRLISTPVLRSNAKSTRYSLSSEFPFPRGRLPDAIEGNAARALDGFGPPLRERHWERAAPRLLTQSRGVEIPSDKDAVRIHVLSSAEEAPYFEAAKRFPALYDLGRLMMNQGCRPEEILELQVTDIDLSDHGCQFVTESRGRRAGSYDDSAESREICARRVMAAGSRGMFEGKVPGTRLAKLNGRHADILDALATCNCSHSQNQHKGGKCACVVSSS